MPIKITTKFSLVDHTLEKSLVHDDIEDNLEDGLKDAEVVKGEYFIVSTLQEMQKLIDSYFETTKTHFVVHKRTKNFGLQGKERGKVYLFCEIFYCTDKITLYSFLGLASSPYVTSTVFSDFLHHASLL